MRAAKVDANQKQIVEDLRNAGYGVAHLHTVGNGIPDILVGINGKNYLFEIKDPSQPPSKQRLTKKEKEFFETWLGHVDVAHTAEDIMRKIALLS